MTPRLEIPLSSLPTPRVSSGPAQKVRPSWPWALGGAAVTVVVVALGALVPASRATASTGGATPPDEAVLVAGSRRYDLQLATTQAQQEAGLGDRPTLAPGAGMLFVYRTPGSRCFWMKGMRFALDMIWLSPRDEVVSVQPDVVPKSFPSVYCAVSQDVVELGAGQAQVAGIKVGRVVRLEMPSRPPS